MVQYRNKIDPPRRVYEKAQPLRTLAAALNVPFLINDRCDIALAVNADGVHLGQSDLPLDLARKLMGSKRIIGISTHCAEEVRAATRGGADYIGFGPIFPTTTKPDHEPVVGLAGLRHIRALTPLPIFAIGGITEATVAEVVAAGANGIAVTSAILDAPDIPHAVNALRRPLS